MYLKKKLLSNTFTRFQIKNCIALHRLKTDTNHKQSRVKHSFPLKLNPEAIHKVQPLAVLVLNVYS